MVEGKGRNLPSKQICKVKNIGPHFILLSLGGTAEVLGATQPTQQVSGFQMKPCSTLFKIS